MKKAAWTLAFVVIGTGVALGQDLMLDDSLRGYTSGTQSGGAFQADGWRVTGKNDYIFWHLPPLPLGKVEWSVRGILPNDGRPGGEDKNEIFHMYDWTYNNADTVYDGYRNNPYKHFIRKTNVLTPAKMDSLEMLWLIAPNYEEPDTDVLSWDPNVTYRFRQEWGPDNAGNTEIRTYRDGVLIMTMSQPGSYVLTGHAFRIAASPRAPLYADFGAPVDAVFSDFKVWGITASGSEGVNGNQGINDQCAGSVSAGGAGQGWILPALLAATLGLFGIRRGRRAGAALPLALLLLTSGIFPLDTHGQSDGTPAAPEISPAGGTFHKVPLSVKISSPAKGVLLRYTLDGSEPTASSKQYAGALALRGTATVKARAFKAGEGDGPVAEATFTIEPAVVVDPLRGATFGRPMGKGEFVAGGGWRSRGGHLLYDAGHPITDGYFEVTMRGLEVPAKGVDKTHPLAGWESKNAYGHYLEQGSFWNWRVGAGYEAFKVLAAPKSIGTRVEERVGSPAAANDGKPHLYRVSWKEGKLQFFFDGKELRTWSFERFQLQYFTLGHDLQYFEISDPAPIISDVKIVDRSQRAPKPAAR